MDSKTQGRASSLPGGILQGLMMGCMITILFLAVSATLIQKEILPMKNIGYCIMVTLFAAAFISAKTASGKVQRQKGAVCLLSGFVYFALLLGMTALLFGGQFGAVGATGGMVAAGSICALLLQGNGEIHVRKKGRQHKRW